MFEFSLLSQLHDMFGLDSGDVVLQLFLCHVPFFKQRKATLTKMRLRLGPWVTRRAPRKATATEVAALATFLATPQAWHGGIAKSKLEPQWQG